MAALMKGIKIVKLADAEGGRPARDP